MWNLISYDINTDQISSFRWCHLLRVSWYPVQHNEVISEKIPGELTETWHGKKKEFSIPVNTGKNILCQMWNKKNPETQEFFPSSYSSFGT